MAMTDESPRELVLLGNGTTNTMYVGYVVVPLTAGTNVKDYVVRCISDGTAIHLTDARAVITALIPTQTGASLSSHIMPIGPTVAGTSIYIVASTAIFPADDEELMSFLTRSIAATKESELRASAKAAGITLATSIPKGI